MLMREGLRQYFEANGFGTDGGYAANWVDITVGPIVFHMPNTDQRKAAVKLHDLHHIITGYRTDLVGEFEISGWELGGNCRGFAAAWVLNLLALAGGVFTSPKRVFRAFVRGLRSSTLYHLPYEGLLDRTVDEVRAEMKLSDGEGSAGLKELVLFGGVVALSFLLVAITIPLVFNPLTALAWLFTYRAWKTAQQTSVA